MSAPRGFAGSAANGGVVPKGRTGNGGVGSDGVLHGMATGTMPHRDAAAHH
ncbi:hypothetical protein [Pandoraea faecigallinarum]|uniref:hypothetical protein n=1 Tax=Pandoraea faecigallinarum TaxID=656179 RepID=UPI000AB17A84|nr:hypothetical protein [Pandoraea faecigallinarum]